MRPRVAERRLSRAPIWTSPAPCSGQGNAHQDSDYIDMELGKSLDRSSRLSLTIDNGITLTDKFLPSATMATFVPQTKNCSKLLGYNAIAEWVEANHYDLAGAVRLVFLELPKHPGDDDYVMEIQFPVRKREVDLRLRTAERLALRDR